MMKYYYYLAHFLNNRYLGILETENSAFSPLRLKHISGKFKANSLYTYMLYPKVDVLKGGQEYLEMMKQPLVTLFVDYTDNEHFIPNLEMYLANYKIENVIILNNKNSISPYKHLKSIDKIYENVFVYLMEKEECKIFNTRYLPNVYTICVVKPDYKIENVVIILFFMFVVLSVILCCLLLYVYLKIRAQKDPVISLRQLKKYPVALFRDLIEPCFDSCLICMEDYKEIDLIRTMPCSHYYHVACIDPWLRRKSARCPYCRKIDKNCV